MVRHPLLRLAVALAVPALALSGCGGSGAGARTVEVSMVDIAFESASLSVRAGEKVRLVFTSRGRTVHDAVVGDAEAQAAAERAGGGGGHAHGSGPPAVHLEPGESDELTYTFDETGTLVVGCHQPGHYDAGMRIDVEVT